MPRRKIISWNGAQNLVCAILKQAADDYISYPNMRPSITKFIRSDYFRQITTIDPEFFEKKLKEICKNEK